MKKYIIILVLINWHSSSHSQTLPISKYKVLDLAEFIVTYSMESKPDTNNLDFIRKEDALLFIGERLSFFTSKNFHVYTQERRKLTTVQQVQEYYNKKGNFYMGFSYLIYKNYPKDNLTFTQPILGGYFKCEESLDLFDWILTGDTATIAGYKTQEATTEFGGRSWSAWFAPEIPFNDGPYKFNGLPGLIIKIYDTKLHYSYELKYIDEAKSNPEIEILETEYVISTKQKFIQAEDAVRKDIINRVKERGMSSESQQVAARNMARRNNPIELKRK